jgi:hypothetical protein
MSIVTENVTITAAPAPSTLQSTGALISQGATTLGTGNYSLITQPSDLTPLLAVPLSITSLAWATNVVTATTTAAHGVATGEAFITTIAGAVPAAYNGTYLATSTGASTFTYPLPLSTTPGAETTPGTYKPRNQGELIAMVNSFFGQGTSQAVYVLELGAGEPAAGVTALATFVTANPGVFYSYLVPRNWDGVASFLTYVAQFEATTAKTYFYVTTTTAGYAAYTPLMKCVLPFIEAPSLPVTEFDAATAFRVALNYAPSSTNKVTPLAFSFVYGVTSYPIKGNAALLQTLQNANVNIIGTGAEGGLTNTLLAYGTTADGNDFTYWYSIDWIQINGDLNVANAVINGSNNPINPLYYSQDGINRLQDVMVATTKSAVTFGMANGSVVRTSLTGPALAAALDAGTYDGQIVVNAVPFIPYLAASPSDYQTGTYSGLSVAYIPMRGFRHILINIHVTGFVAS